MIQKDQTRERLTLDSVRRKLATKRGPEYWRSLDELSQSDEFLELLHREFPKGASVLESGVERRSFLKCIGASLALAGLSAACSRQPNEQIVPYVKAPVELTPGTPLFFATAMPLHGFGIGLLAENHTGRPTKVEGNPNHPASLGSSDTFTQASILSLYDPDRSTVTLRRGTITTWETFVAALDVHINGEKDATGATITTGLRGKNGAGIRFLTGTITSPTLAAQMQEVLAAFPEARWHQYEPVNRDFVNAGAQMAFGAPINTIYRFDLADVVVSLDANFLAEGPGRIRYSRDFAARRDAENGAKMNRLYVIESTPTVTGAMGDHFIHVRPSEIEAFARAIARRLGLDAPGEEPEGERAKFVDAVARDLQAHKGASILIAGEGQPPVVHAICHAINEALGNAGTTVAYTDVVEANPVDQMESLRTLVRDMDSGAVDTLFIMGVNPVYDAPADLGFVTALQKVNHRVHLGLYMDETAEHCHWHVPEAHYLESWSDCRAYDGTVSIIQPLIAPLYAGKTAHELIAALFGKGGTSYQIVRQYWQQQMGQTGFENLWREALAKGIVDNTQLPLKSVAVASGVTSTPQTPLPVTELEVSFRPDPTVGDGRWANNGWLQELPKPLTRITWDNAVLVSLRTAEKYGLGNFDYVNATLGNRTIRGQVWIQPNHPDNVVTLHLGYGRTRAGQVGSGAGFNAYLIRTSDAPWFACGLKLERYGKGPELARTELHSMLHEHGRPLARMGTLEEFQAHPDFAHHLHNAHAPAPEMTLYPDPGYEGYAWGMAIDLNRCTGCGACTLACQAENNIPVVGKEQVRRQREMHWIRVDRYYKFEEGKDDPAGELDVVHQPVPCMQCENAPCEVVCPVAATVHSKEGLNDMVYNRCVGTRYCSNNCPYKVRRFNFFAYSDLETPTKQMMYNPDVTVRTRGVMEKCTYCVQRINLARIDAKKEGRSVRDGEVIPACQQACPSQAIIFGDIGDKNSQVAKAKSSPRNYALLADLNTRPRTTYLAKLQNRNPELSSHSEGPAEHGVH